MNLEELVTYQIGGLIGKTPHPCLYFEWVGDNSQAVKRAWISTDKQIKAVEERPNFRKWLSRDDLNQVMEEMRRINLEVSEEAWKEAKQRAAAEMGKEMK